VATLRDYLSCEFKVKYPNAPLRQYNKENMFGCLVKVPQQQNFTDCGLFLLQYVEQFFSDPIKDYRNPIKSLISWFHQDIVTRKREDISQLIKKLMRRDGFDDVELPEIDFPTRDGRVLEMIEPPANDTQTTATAASEDAFEEDPNYAPAGEEIKESSQPEETISKKVYMRKRPLEKADNGNGENSNIKTPKVGK
jgi:sentrin-specific protease 7